MSRVINFNKSDMNEYSPVYFLITNHKLNTDPVSINESSKFQVVEKLNYGRILVSSFNLNSKRVHKTLENTSKLS